MTITRSVAAVIFALSVGAFAQPASARREIARASARQGQLGWRRVERYWNIT